MSAAAQPVDWERFLRQVEWHRVAGIVHRTLASHPQLAVPAQVRATVAHSAAAGAQRSIRATMRLAQILRAFQASAIPLCILKGIPLSQQIFQDIGVRDSRDIDVLVPRGDVRRADQQLAELGFIRVHPSSDESAESLAAFIERHVHFEYMHAASRQKVELHWRLWDSEDLGPSEPPPASWEPFVMQGLTMQVLPPELLLPYLCVHGSKHAWFRMKWLLDVAWILQTQPSAAEALMATAQAWNSTVPAVQSLQLSHRLFGTVLPLAAKSPGWQVRLSIRNAMAALETGGVADTPREEYISSRRQQWARLLLSRRPGYMLRESWEWLAALGGWQDDHGPQRVVKLMLWAPRWVTRRIGMLFSS